ncbi:mechanosensitive ion channel [Marichromatium bheemlicum]|uniref:Mechanosensitive ion channel n=1 Tax=Marichromatium bheemlicum TaxID=365339 RepID=A0ABX1ICX0_9GAMM|nr:mechanosensitive ion channel [Marichromatium bheemlicum]
MLPDTRAPQIPRPWPVLLLCLALLFAPPLLADTTANQPTVSQIEARTAEVENSTTLDEADKATLLELYRRARANLEDTRNFELKADEFAHTLETAPRQRKSAERELEAARGASTTPAEVIPTGLGSEAIAQRLNKALADIAVEETRLSELEKLTQITGSRPTSARARLAEVKQALDQLGDPPGADSVVEGQPGELLQAQRWAHQTRRQALWSEARMLEQELLSQPARLALYQIRRDLAALRLKRLRTYQRALEELQNQRRNAEAEAAQRASEQTQREVADKHPVVQQQAQLNAEISASLTRIARQLETLGDHQVRIDGERKRIEEDFRGAQQRLEAAGLSRALGQVLLDRRTRLPDLRQYRKDIDNREDEIAEASLRQIRYREEQRRLRDRERYVDELTLDVPEGERAQVRAQLDPVLDQRRRLLAQSLDIEDDYIRQLTELNYATDQVVSLAESYDDFLAERLLWVRSSPPVGLETLTSLPAATTWLLSWEGAWEAVVDILHERLRHAWGLWIWLFTVSLLLWRLTALRRAIRASAEPLRRVRTDSIRHTVKAIALTLLMALPIPLLMWLLGQQLQASTEATAFTRAFASALIEVSSGLYFLLAFRGLCITGGVADRHFRWSTATLARIRHAIDWFSGYIVPIALVTIAAYDYNNPAHTGDLMRLTLVACMIGFTAFFWHLLSPSKGLFKGILAEHPQGWLNRLRLLWFPLVVGAPLALAGLALAGYVYTAGILFRSLVGQTWLVLTLLVVHQTIVRWLIVTRRRLALQAALERQAARRAQSNEPSVPTEVLQLEEAEPDLAAMDEQTRRLINASIFFAAVVGLWITWSDVLPAFSMFERFALWHYEGTIDGVSQMVPVTAADIGLVLVIIFVTMVAAKNLPALIEILLLQSDVVSAGGRYAIKTLASYTITAVAFLLAFSTLGLSWSQVQWLVAALSVGIGFGLQEIVANFISGLIILFERPVRVGDIVTIGETTGVVTNIQIRATTIRNWDKQELLVPNKEFITERLLNWSLTDQQNRVTIPVGIAYGSDTRQALEILTQVAEQHEKVLEDPAPLISFEGFGDDALTLVMRCYLDSLDGRIAIITELHQAIYDRFNEAGIEIAFPQRDVHLSAHTPLDVRLHRAVRAARDSGDESSKATQTD